MQSVGMVDGRRNCMVRPVDADLARAATVMREAPRLKTEMTNIRQIQLERLWHLGARIGSGGFGQVFEATDNAGDRATAKLVPKEPGARRELLFVDLADVRNVIPVLESGEVDVHFVLIMPRADKSLRQHLDGIDRPLGPAEAIPVLMDIATALSDLDERDEKVVHRDLKPENILLYKGKWCLADFGISRYAEAATAADTRKRALSPPYAAPERWRDERATIAADVYSLGVVAHELLSKSLPLSGNDRSELREQHLHGEPSFLTGISPNLAALVQECLCKAAGARPRPRDILDRLQRIGERPRSAGLAKLQAAHRNHVEHRTESARFESWLRSERDRRSRLFDDAKAQLDRMRVSLQDEIVAAAPSADLYKDSPIPMVVLGGARLEFELAHTASMEPWEGNVEPAFTVIGYSTISITNRRGSKYEGRSHSLWFCDAVEEDRFRWFELAFMMSPLVAHQSRWAPFALDPGKHSAQALSNVIGKYQVAWPFTPLAVGELDEFISRWSGWLAEAADGTLQRPGRMPELPTAGSWRR